MNKLTYVLFHKVSWEQLSGEVGDFVANLLQYLYANNYRNIIQFDKYNTVWQSYCKYKKGAIFIAPQCRPITVRVQLFSVAEKMSRISHEIPVNRLPYKIKRRQFWSCLCQLPMIRMDICHIRTNHSRSSLKTSHTTTKMKNPISFSSFSFSSFFCKLRYHSAEAGTTKLCTSSALITCRWPRTTTEVGLHN